MQAGHCSEAAGARVPDVRRGAVPRAASRGLGFDGVPRCTTGFRTTVPGTRM